MKISLNWLKQYISLSEDAEKIGETLTSIGLEVESIEKHETIKGGLAGLVIGEVVQCEKHPNADRLSITRVNVGLEQPLQIVCGASNVAFGQKVVVATVGTTLHPLQGDSFIIQKGKIRGETSEGMICAEDEIGLGTSHDGIIVLPNDVVVGTPAKNYFKVETDYIFEIGLTPNRSDATNHIGVARDLAAAMSMREGLNLSVKMPSVDEFKVQNNDLSIEVRVENEIACPRYSGVSISGVSVGDSPDWLKNRLLAIGVRPINNIVDITNFVLHELGQPLHAFDADEITERQVLVKNLAEGTTFLALDGQERKLSAEDLMICDGNAAPMCIGGVFGGLNSGVKAQTRNIFLEAAHFSAKTIRRSSTRHQLKTDAAKIFEKGSDPNITAFALKRAALLIQALAGGQISSDIVDIYPKPIPQKEIEVTHANITRLIGMNIAKNDIEKIFNVLDFQIKNENAKGYVLSIPTNKVDVTREADVIEEILRIYGFNQIEIPSQVRSALTYQPTPNDYQLRNLMSDFLSSNGYQEMMGLSISQSKYYQDLFPVPQEELVYINNTSNISLDLMRPTLLFSALETVVHNQNRQQSNLKLYEFGKTYLKQGEQFAENRLFSITLVGKEEQATWLNETANRNVSFFTLKNIVINFLQRLGLQTYQEEAISNHVAFSFGVQFHRGKDVLATFGKVQPKIAKFMNIKHDVYYAEIQWDIVLKMLETAKVEYEEVSKFPTMRRDLALLVDKTTTFAAINQIARKTEKKLLKEVNLFSVFEDENKLGEGKKSYAVSFLFEDKSKTLSDQAVDAIMEKLIENYQKDIKAIIRK